MLPKFCKCNKRTRVCHNRVFNSHFGSPSFWMLGILPNAPTLMDGHRLFLLHAQSQNNNFTKLYKMFFQVFVRITGRIFAERIALTEFFPLSYQPDTTKIKTALIQ